MSSTTFGSLIAVEPTMSQSLQDVAPPQKAHAKTYHSVPTPRQEDVDNLQWGAKLNGPAKMEETSSLGGDLEMSRPGTPTNDDETDGSGFGVVQSFSNPPMNRYRMTTVCLLNFAGGFNDSAPGALIPYMEKYTDHPHIPSITYHFIDTIISATQSYPSSSSPTPLALYPPLL